MTGSSSGVIFVAGYTVVDIDVADAEASTGASGETLNLYGSF